MSGGWTSAWRPCSRWGCSAFSPTRRSSASRGSCSAGARSKSTPEPMVSAVELRAVSKEFIARDRRVPAIERIDLSVARNEFAAILGPSGCGKSTLLNMVAGFLRPTTGRILVDGAPVEGPDPRRGVVFQEAALFPWYTVLDNVTFGPKTRGIPVAQYRPKVDMLLDLVGLRGFERQHQTVLFITHDIEEALLLADSVSVMTARPGRIKARIAVDLPRPRPLEVTTSPRFNELKRQVLALVREESLRAATSVEPS